jgi:hypothetical protein
MRKPFITLSLLAACATVSAQTMYRCGNTFSQVPCGQDAKAQPVPKGAMDTPSAYSYESENLRRARDNYDRAQKNLADVTKVIAGQAALEKARLEKAVKLHIVPTDAEQARNAEKCADSIRYKLKDPDSMRESRRPIRIAEPTIQMTENGMAAWSYAVGVNAKNSYGGYTGSKSWVCLFDLDEKTVLGVEQLSPN